MPDLKPLFYDFTDGQIFWLPDSRKSIPIQRGLSCLNVTPFLTIMVHYLWTIFRKRIVLDHAILKTLDMMGYINGGSHYFGPYWTILDRILDHILKRILDHLDRILDYFGPYWTIFEHMRSCWSILAHSIGQNIFKTLPIKNISQQDRFTTSNRYITIPHHDTTPTYHTGRLHFSTTEKNNIPFRFDFFSSFSFSLFRILLLSLKFNYHFFFSFYKILLFESSAINLMTWTNVHKKT